MENAVRIALSTLALALLVACPETDGTTTAPDDLIDDEPVVDDGLDPNGHTPQAAASGSSFDFTDGEVLLKGTVAYPGAKTGRIRLDLLTQEGIAAPMLVSAEEVAELGAFELKVPKGFGELHILGFIDEAGDGPSEDDPSGSITIEVGEVDIEGLELNLSDDPDLGDLRPGPPPEGQEGGPPGGEPPEGVPEGLPLPGADDAEEGADAEPAAEEGADEAPAEEAAPE